MISDNGRENDTEEAIQFLHGGSVGTVLTISGSSSFASNFGGDVTVLDPIITQLELSIIMSDSSFERTVGSHSISL